jgi:3-methyladenine DNA glycosylase AlkC
MISVCKESACASVLWIRESVFNESEQVESTHVESVEEVVVSFEQEVKATKAAINNTFFI